MKRGGEKPYSKELGQPFFLVFQILKMKIKNFGFQSWNWLLL
jgi:hypothetical protein